MYISKDYSVEKVLILQGGGSLGAYECGVFKTLSKYKIKFDIVAGTSIGAINAAIITAYRKDKDPVKELENFWLELSEKIIRLPMPYSTLYFNDEMRAILSSMYSATFGNSKAFSRLSMFQPYNFFSFKIPYPLFDISPLKDTLDNYVDFSTLQEKVTTDTNSINNDGYHSMESIDKRPRLIVTSTNIQTSRPVIFDSTKITFDSAAVIASAGFPFYGISWTKIDDRYLWDGSLLSNTPLREVIDVSPTLDKIVYLISIFPHYQKQLPQDMFEAWHRARDIVYNDKTDSDIKTSKMYSKSLSLLKEMYDLLQKYNNTLKKDKDSKESDILSNKLKDIEKNYFDIRIQRGSIIRKIIRIERPETTPFLFEDADFSEITIKKLIRQGEDDTVKALFEEQVNE